MEHNEQPTVFGAIVSDHHVRYLVAAYCSGSATDEEVANLSELISSSPAVRDYYIAHATLASQLTVYAKASQEDVPASSSVVIPNLQAWSVVKTMTAACLALAILLGGLMMWRAGSLPIDASGARVIGQLSYDAGNGSPSPLEAGQTVSIETGECKISLNNGVELVISSPASFSIESPMRCRLWKGRLTADVPQQAIGFRVLTKHADIVDQGTRFGVAVEPDFGTDIAVFEGLVDVASHDQPLSVGRAVSISADGKLSRLQLVTPETFEPSSKISNTRLLTIISVKDNIRSSEELGYYRVVPGGFFEDQPAYVDRVHQWNGVDAKGLPEELLGGDYVMPFNDDKLQENFEITVTLSRESNLYVLFDDRNATPKWLAKSFVDTGFNVGQDEGHVPGNKTIMEIATGGGQSIDTEFSVWKSRIPVNGEVTLQGLWKDADQKLQADDDPVQNKRSMYGVVAVPITTP